MSEMKPAERVTLDTLRKSALAKMSDADFANLETEVALKGIRNLDGWFGSEVRKAVEQVLKHPGQHDQSVHGGGKGGGKSPSATPAPASAGGGGGGSSASSFKVGDKVEYKVKFGGKESLVRGRVVGVTPKGNLKIKPKNKRDGLGITLDPAKVTAGHSSPDPARSAAGRLGAKTRSDNEMPPTYTSML